MPTVGYESSALRELEGLPERIQERVHAAVQRLASDPLAGKALKAELKMLRSLRVGDYRVLYQFFPREQRVVIVHVANRRDVYR